MGLPWVETEPGRVTQQHREVNLSYGRAESLPPHLHLVKQRFGRRGDTPPVGRQDALLKATVGAEYSRTPSLLFVTV